MSVPNSSFVEVLEMYSLTLTEEQKDDMLTALLEYRDSISKFDQFSAECERLEELIDLVTWLKPIKEDDH